MDVYFFPRVFFFIIALWVIFLKPWSKSAKNYHTTVILLSVNRLSIFKGNIFFQHRNRCPLLQCIYQKLPYRILLLVLFYFFFFDLLKSDWRQLSFFFRKTTMVHKHILLLLSRINSLPKLLICNFFTPVISISIAVK